MNKKRTKCILLLIVIFVIFSVLLCACSETNNKIPIPTVKEDIFVYDTDNIINDDVEKELNQLLAKFEEKTEAEVVVITIPSLLDRSIEDYSHNLFNTLGIGKKGKDNGFLLLISRNDTKVRLEIGRGFEESINDAKAGRILDTYFVPYRENDEYTEGTKLTVYSILATLSEEYDFEIDGLDSSLSINSESEDDEDSLIWFILLLIIIIAIVIAFFVDSSSGGSGYSGGFFSSSGSSSSGSFGGGSTGGGGVSR